jgi:hypothetical protein
MVPHGKAPDLAHAGPIEGSTQAHRTNRYEGIEGAMSIVTAGAPQARYEPRRPS